jgi:hypothetical protein
VVSAPVISKIIRVTVRVTYIVFATFETRSGSQRNDSIV